LESGHFFPQKKIKKKSWGFDPLPPGRPGAFCLFAGLLDAMTVEIAPSHENPFSVTLQAVRKASFFKTPFVMRTQRFSSQNGFYKRTAFASFVPLHLNAHSWRTHSSTHYLFPRV